MKSDIKVSVVIPIYNQEAYLRKSISSVLTQSYQDLEIIAVNDGSTDSSQQIMEEFANQDSRVFLYEKSNGGLVDATIYGAEMATGDYIIFLDPDDYIGKNYIQKFVSHLNYDYDFVAMRFYYDDKDKVTPYRLKENLILNKTHIELLRSTFLTNFDLGTISNQIFISRWNKLYHCDIVKSVISEFKSYKNVTLGEDTIFTALLLKYSQSAKILQQANTYFYNIANQNSMMKSSDLDKYLSKCYQVFMSFSKLLEEQELNKTQAYYLYFFLTNTLFNRLRTNDPKQFYGLFDKLKREPVYIKTLNVVRKNTKSKSISFDLFLRRYMTYSQYIYIKDSIERTKAFVRNFKYFSRQVRKNNIIKAYQLLSFFRSRQNAFYELKSRLPRIEEKINNILLQHDSNEFNEEEGIENKIFVFWWDGFNDLPDIVAACFKSLKKQYQEYQIIPISKDNFEEYTDIHPVLLKDFKAGKISIQTFSDILRFNLLKNNGGMWVDATIYFTRKVDLFSQLERQSFATISFSTSKDFLEYKGEFCSWTGYFIASRKNGRFVQIMDMLFREYYLKYRNFQIYFFIDALFMICKVNKIDSGVLDNPLYIEGNMWTLSNLLKSKYDDQLLTLIKKIPQKLAWFFEPLSDSTDTFYSQLISKEIKRKEQNDD